MQSMRKLLDLLGIDVPVIQAPMAGASSAELVAAVANAGGLGSYGCSRLSPAQVIEEAERIRALTNRSFNLGFFCHDVPEVTPEQDFGFLLTKEGGLLYFHRNSLLSGDIDDLKRGDDVYYNEDVGDTGPIATKVRVKARSLAAE